MPICDDQLTGDISLALALVCVAVADLQAFDVEAVEGSPDVRVVVDADHHLALAAAHEVGH